MKDNELNLISVSIICVTLFLLVLVIGFLAYEESVDDSEYENCLESCQIDENSLRFECVKDCNDHFRPQNFSLHIYADWVDFRSIGELNPILEPITMEE